MSENIPFWGTREVWKRFIARQVDFFVVLYAVVAGALVFGVREPISEVLEFGALVLAVALGFPIEALLLSRVGMTPGKWLFCVKLRTLDGEKLSFYTALRRGCSAFRQGLAFGIPIISLFALSRSYQYFVTHGEMKWDRDFATVVSCQPMDTLRIGIAITFFAAMAVLSAVAR